MGIFRIRWDRLKAAGVSTLAGALLIGSFASHAEPLDGLSDKWPEANLRAALDPAGSMLVEQGTNFRIRIASDEEASVLLVLVNSEARARLFIPHRQGTADRIEPGSEMLVPDLLSGETLYADMPVGKATVYVIVSSEPLIQNTADSAGGWVPMTDIDQRLTAAVSAAHDVRLAVSRIPLRIESPALKDFVSTEEFVQFFGVATRSVSNVERGFAVQFAYDSAELTDWGRRQLDAVGHGMIDPRLSGDRFLIEGHTDDIGTDAYNLDLSGRRAASVARYLNGLGVKSDRLKQAAMGKAGPAEPGTSEQARAANRRVVIRRLDSKS